jgi:NAD+ kinase
MQIRGVARATVCVVIDEAPMKAESRPARATAPPRRLGLVLHPRHDLLEALDMVSRWAASAGVALVGRDDERLPSTVQRCTYAKLARRCDVVLALGGDGTFLTALRVAAPHRVPVLGANLGEVGYLTEVGGDHLPDALEALAAGRFAVEERFALTAMWRDNGRERERVAYNDVVLSRVPRHGQARLGLSVDGELLVRYASDGVIVATPLGSTGYSFAAGGPMVSPQSRALVVTPDAPHGLFNRSVILGHDERLGIEVLPASAPVALEVDGQLMARATAGWRMEVAPAAAPALVVQLGAAGFAERARRKLPITDGAAVADLGLTRQAP